MTKVKRKTRGSGIKDKAKQVAKVITIPLLMHTLQAAAMLAAAGVAHRYKK